MGIDRVGSLGIDRSVGMPRSPSWLSFMLLNLPFNSECVVSLSRVDFIQFVILFLG